MGFWESLFESSKQAARDPVGDKAAYRMGLLAGFDRGFTAARERIAVMLEEEGRGQTAQRVRNIQLKRKQKPPSQGT
jgi:hypothetical protein